MATKSGAVTWQTIKGLTIDALDASLSRLAKEQKGEQIARNSSVVPPPGQNLQVLSNLNKKWSDQEYYVVPSDMNDGTPGARHRVQFSGFKASKVTLALPEETRLALAGAPRVNVFCTSSIDIKLKKALRAALKNSPRGPLVEMLSSGEETLLRPWSPKHLPADRPLNIQQQYALAAMTTPGAFFIWGPPGTGKTSVITAAVRHSLAEGKSVLLSSHTHVAVDNVLEGLIDQSGDGATASLLKPGSVIRFASQQVQDKIAQAVQGHPHLLYNKAAAVLTNHAEETRRLQELRKRNQEAPPREALRTLVDELAQIDIDEVRAAYATVELAAQLGQRQQDLADHVQLEKAATHRLELVVLELQSLTPPSSASEADALYRMQRAERVLSDAEAALLPLARNLEALQLRRRALVDDLQECRGDIARGSSRFWFPQRKKLESKAEQLSNALADVDRDIVGTEGDWRVRQQQRRSASDDIEAVRRALEEVEEARTRRDRALGLEAEARASLQEIRRGRLAAESEVARLEVVAAKMPAAAALIADASARGLDTKISALEQLTEQVDALDSGLKDLERKQKRLDDEMSETQRKLLHEAPVVATTLASLTTNRQLLERRFDVVILDEVASAEAPSVVYAGSRADTTLALVGDFLQNAPIAEADDPTTPSEAERSRWQRDDIFELFGIRDRHTAEQHKRCVPLKRQYRYPSVIADLVNKFCYKGLLESHRSSTPEDGKTIRLIDTYSHPRKTLERDGNSWCSPLGLDLLSYIAQRGPGVKEGSIGFVSPYRPQAKRAQERMRREKLSVDCGTSHAFQGREFDSVIFDLMQDGSARWVGEADLDGSRRQVSAAKLLNVGITRAKKHLYLIGDWDFIQRSTMPGMAAISALAGHENFEVIKAERLIGPA
ncbi:DEAD/DEAH box helicase [Blastococcus sp. SYSU DS0753]